MAFAVTAISANSNTTTGTRTITVPAGGVPSGALAVLLVASAANAAPNGGSVTDAGSNTYTYRAGASNNNSTADGYIAAYTAPIGTALTSGQLITYTKAVSGTATRVVGIYVTGHDPTTPVDAAACASNYGSSTTPTVQSGVPAVANSLFIGGVTMEISGASINAPGGSWTNFHNVITTRSLEGDYQVGSGTSQLTHNPTFNAPHLWGSVMVVVSPPGGGGSPQNVTMTTADLTFAGFALGVNAKRQITMATGAISFDGQALATSVGQATTITKANLILAGQALSANAKSFLSVTKAGITFAGQTLGANAKSLANVARATLTFAGRAATVIGTVTLAIPQAVLRFTGQAISTGGRALTGLLNLLGIGL